MASTLLAFLTFLAANAKEETVLRHPKIVILFDVSGSMATVDTGQDPASRQDQIIRFLTEKKGKQPAFLQRLLQKAEVTAYRFGAALDDFDVAQFQKGQTWTREQWARWLKPDGKNLLPPGGEKPVPLGLFERLVSGTNVAGAALQALAREKDNYVQALVIFSDGRSQQTPEELQNFLKKARDPKRPVPVFTIGVGASRPPVRLFLDAPSGPEEVRPEDKFLVRVPVRGQGLPDQEFQVFLDVQRVTREGKPAAGEKKYVLAPVRGKFKVDPGGESVDFDINLSEILKLSPEEIKKGALEGTWQFVARAAKHPREAAAQGEHVSRPLRVVVQERKPRVLLFAGGPSREYQFLRTLFLREAQEKRLELSIHLQTGKEENVDQGVDRDRLLTRFPDKLVSDNPKDRFACITEYDVVISIDPDWTALSLDQLKLLRTWVSEFAGGVVFVAGPVHTYHLGGGPSGIELTPLQAIYPVVLYDSRLRGLHDPSRPYLLELTPAARLEPYLKLNPTDDSPTFGWETFFWGKDGKPDKGKRPLRGFYNYYPVEKLRPASIVLANFIGPQSSKINDGRVPQPFIVFMRYGQGKTLYIGSPETWRLRQFRAEYHQRFWLGLTRYIAAPAGLRKNYGGILLGHVTPSGVVALEAQIRGKDLLPLPRDQVPIVQVRRLHDPDAKPLEVKLQAQRKPGEWTGWFAGAFKLPKLGEYEFRIPIPGTAAFLSHRYTFGPADPEQDDVRADFAHLHKLASPAQAELKRLPARIRKKILALEPPKGVAEADLKEGPRFFFRLAEAEIVPELLPKLPPKQFPKPKTPPEVKESPDKEFRSIFKAPRQVKILVIDGEGKRGREENGDSYFLKHAITAIPGNRHEVIFGDELAGGVPARALERDDLAKFDCIFLLNVERLTAKQQANLEKYAKQGGGVAFFLGPLVSSDFYNKQLYQGGKGIFPVPLETKFYPPHGEKALKPEISDEPQLLLRDDLFPELDQYPILGKVFHDSKWRKFLSDLPIHRYFKVPRGDWRPDSKRVFELATLPIRGPSTRFQREVLQLVHQLSKLLDGNESWKKQYGSALTRHRRQLVNLVAPTSDKQADHLARALENMLLDRGRPKEHEQFPDLTEFWKEPKIRPLLEDVVRLRQQILYGDPLVVAHHFGKGRVMAVMTTLGKEWSDWAGGSMASLVFAPFLWETVNYLSGQEAQEPQMPPPEAKQPPEFSGVDVDYPARHAELPKGKRVIRITPDARIPLRGMVRADFGLAQAHWIVKVEPAEIEMVIGKHWQDGVALRGNSLAASVLLSFTGGPGAGLGYWTWAAHVLAGDQNRNAELRIPLENFAQKRDRRALDDLARRLLDKRPPESGYFLKYSFREEDGFDFRKYLPGLKPKEQEIQRHYLVHLGMAATDKDKNTRRSEPLVFLVVSPNELLSQFFKEEEVLSERLEKVMGKVTDAKGTLNEQIAKLGLADVDLDLVAIRVDQVHKALSDAAGITREIAADCNRILTELKINRVSGDKVPTLEKKIVEPLERLVGPAGGFHQAEEAVRRLMNLINEDRGKKGATNQKTLKHAPEVRKQLDRLEKDVDEILEHILQGIVFNQVVEMLMNIEGGRPIWDRQTFDINSFKRFMDELRKKK